MLCLILSAGLVACSRLVYVLDAPRAASLSFSHSLNPLASKQPYYYALWSRRAIVLNMMVRQENCSLQFLEA